MRIAFFGTGDFAVPTLKLLTEKNYTINPVVTIPPRPQGRGRRILPSPVEKVAKELGLVVATPENPNSIEFINYIRSYSLQCCVLVDYGFIIKEPLLKIPSYGFINLHPSLLPRYRGPAPIPRQLMDGCSEVGLTVFLMSKGVDSGDILTQMRVPVEENETCGDLSQRLAVLGAELVMTTLNQIEQGVITPQPQDHTQATKAPKITPEERIINWERPAREIHNRIRALSPEPGAWTTFRGKRLLIIRSKVIDETPSQLTPGAIITELPGVVVATGKGLLELVEVKPENRNLITGKEFKNGYRLQPQDRMGI